MGLWYWERERWYLVAEEWTKVVTAGKGLGVTMYTDRRVGGRDIETFVEWVCSAAR